MPRNKMLKEVKVMKNERGSNRLLKVEFSIKLNLLQISGCDSDPALPSAWKSLTYGHGFKMP